MPVARLLLFAATAMRNTAGSPNDDRHKGPLTRDGGYIRQKGRGKIEYFCTPGKHVAATANCSRAVNFLFAEINSQIPSAKKQPCTRAVIRNIYTAEHLNLLCLSSKHPGSPLVLKRTEVILAIGTLFSVFVAFDNDVMVGLRMSGRQIKMVSRNSTRFTCIPSISVRRGQGSFGGVRLLC